MCAWPHPRDAVAVAVQLAAIDVAAPLVPIHPRTSQALQEHGGMLLTRPRMAHALQVATCMSLAAVSLVPSCCVTSHSRTIQAHHQYHHRGQKLKQKVKQQQQAPRAPQALDSELRDVRRRLAEAEAALLTQRAEAAGLSRQLQAVGRELHAANIARSRMEVRLVVLGGAVWW
eukprot:351402-Chlamydomonas_euryale.AAC.4